MNRNVPPRPKKLLTAHSRYPWLDTSWRRSHHSCTMPNGSSASHTNAKPIMPSSIPVPMRPAADSFVKRSPWRAYRKSTTIKTITESTPLMRVKRS